jgi:hypothetical protein
MDGEELTSPRLSPGELAALMRPLELDLMAAYALMRDELIAELHAAARRGDTDEDFLRRVQDMIGAGPPEPEEWIG